ncbi:MAG TPA: class I SAM-dependent methyltransferase [Nitrolancea sp.]|nr:class I SAM-dependent methyltransferase [Nitrolancea sp.]
MEPERVIDEMIAYYRARAAEYDEWFYRRNRYDHGPEINQRWFNDVAELEAAFHTICPVDAALELAAGTGIWTEKLVTLAKHVTVVDASPEMIAINQGKLPGAPVTYIQASIFDWEPERTYDLVFFSFWLSHVPPERVDDFLAKVRRSIRNGGKLFIIDSRFEQTGAAKNNPLFEDEETYRTRILNDGNQYTIVKVYYQIEHLRQLLQQAGFAAEVKFTNEYFIVASAVAC